MYRNAGDTEIHLLSLKLLADQVDVVNFGAIGTHSPHTNIYAAVAAVDNYPAKRVEVRENKMASASPRQISIDVEIQTPALPASLLGPGDSSRAPSCTLSSLAAHLLHTFDMTLRLPIYL